MKFTITFSLILSILATGTFAQTLVHADSKSKCGSQVPDAAWDLWFNQKVEEFKNDQNNLKSQTTYVIPIVVHVIHGGQNIGTFPNVSQAQINSQIPVLNNDFAGSGFNSGNVPAAFAALKADCNISFCMAQLDPNGNSLQEPGINRVNYNTIQGATNPAAASSQNAFFNLMDNTIKPNTIWDPTRYLNIWISDAHNAIGILGYASFPSGSGLTGLGGGTGTALDDGVWIWTRSFGTINVMAPYNRGRTATHEVGHWLGLRHVWGDSNCGTDFCNDTPVQQTSNFGCPNFPKVTCTNGPNGDMFMNFMDYSDDPCLYMFTPDQRTRMHTALANGPFRNMLTASSSTMCNLPAIVPTAYFSYHGDGCVDSTIYTNNQSSGMPGPTYSWSAQPSNGVSFSPNQFSAHPSIQFLAPGAYTISVVASNSQGNSTSADILYIADCGDIEGINENQVLQNSISVAPNPTNGKLNVSFNLPLANGTKISVINTIGQELLVSNVTIISDQSIEVNLGNLPDGVYTLSVVNHKGRAFKRIILNK
jgi:hypothetical protein